MGGEPSRARITSIREVAPEVFELDATMVSPPAIDVHPGQYVSVVVPGTSDRRAYSIASAPGRRDGFTLLVRRIGGVGSVFLANVAPGHTLEFEGPRGDFLLDPAHPGDAVFAATGVGAAPLFPMMEATLDRDERGRVVFCWGLMGPTDLFWRDRLDRLMARPRFTSTVVLTSLGQGFVTEPVIATVSQLRDPIYYLCGNGQMIRDVIDGLLSRGIDRERQIRTDLA